MSRGFRFFLIPVLITLLASCMPGPSASGAQKAVRSEKPRADTAQVEERIRRQQAMDNNAFALDLYHHLPASEDGLFYSPYSISLALAMTYAGARDKTALQMKRVLHFSLPDSDLHPALNAIDQELASRKNTAGKGADGKGFRLNIVNDIWGQAGYSFKPEFLDLLAMNYGSGLRQLDFQSDPEAARKAINDYIASQTEKRIQELLKKGIIDPATRMVLTNAIYFNAAWMHPFDKAQTKPAPFTRLDGSKVEVPLMKQPDYESAAYVDGDGFQAVSLPYENGDLSMLLLVPDLGRFADFESSLDTAKLGSILGQMKMVSVLVAMPGFKLESEFSLKKELSEMGMVDAFDAEKADFSGMDGTRNLSISEVVHKSFIKVDEAGTEAAAATAVVMRAAAMATHTVDLTIDRPFIFAIRDEPTGSILFIGKVLEPGK